MSKASYTLYIIIATLILAGCQGESKYYSRLCALDSVLVQSPDSVYKVLIAEEKVAQQQSRSDRMYYELLRADAQNKAYIDFTTDSVMLQVADYYDHHGTANQQMRAHYLLGCTYRDLGDAPMELQCFLEATEKADTTQKDCDLYTLAAIYGQMADIYDHQYLPEYELEVLEKCKNIALKDKDTISSIVAEELRLRAYYLLNEEDSVLKISDKTRNKYISTGEYRKAARLLNPAITILIDRKEYKKASEYINFFENYSVCNNCIDNIADDAILFLYDKGRYYLYENKIDSARYCFERLLRKNEKEAAYKGFVLLYQTIDKADSLAKYSILYTEANDNSYQRNTANTIAQMTVMYDYGYQQRIASVKTKEAAHAKARTRYITAISIIAILCISYIVFRIKRSKDKKITEMTISYMDAFTKKEHLEADIRKERLEMEEKIVLLEEQYAGQLDSLKHNISQIQKENYKALAEKEKELQALQYQLNYYSETIDINNTEKRLIAFIGTDIYKKLKASINFKVVEMKLTDSDWKQFWDLYHNYFPDYHAFIMGNTLLTNDEKHLCLLLILGFSPKQMSRIFDKSMSRISNLRAGINQKLFRDNSALSLDGNIRKIFYYKQKSTVSSQ